MKRFKQNCKRKFTYWYIKKGYTFRYDKENNPIWDCPWWVRPLLILFSPSIYTMRKCGEIFCESFRKGIQEFNKSINEATIALNKFSEHIKEKQAGIDI